MPVGGRARGGKRGRATIASVLGIELEREKRRRTSSHRCDTIDTRRQDNVSLIVPNKRASDFTPGDKEQGIGGE